MTPFIAPADYPRWKEVRQLLIQSFAYMDAVIGHPTRVSKLSQTDIEAAAATGQVFLIEQGRSPVACLFTRPSRDIPNALYLGWFAVTQSLRNRGAGRQLIDIAASEARHRGHTALTLDTGIELTALHATFVRLGFERQKTDSNVVTFVKTLNGPQVH